MSSQNSFLFVRQSDIQRAIGRVVPVAWLLLSGYATTLVAADAQQREEDIATLCIAGIRANQAALRTGEYHATGEMVAYDIHTHDVKSKRPLAFSCVFDGGSRRFERLDSNRSMVDIHTPEERLTLIEPELVEPTRKSSSDSKPPAIISRSAPSKQAGIDPKNFLIGSFDVRDLGVLGFHELESGLTSDDCFEACERDAQLVEAVEESKGIYRLVWIGVVNDDAQMRRVLRVDSNLGFTPVHIEVRGGGPNSTPDWESLPVNHESRVSWSKHGDVYVPVRCEFSMVYGAQKGYLDFSWKSVNATSVPETFSVTGLNAPDGTYVVDQTLGTPVVESIIGEAARERLIPESNARWSTVFMLLNIVLIIGIIIVIAMLRARKAS